MFFRLLPECGRTKELGSHELPGKSRKAAKEQYTRICTHCVTDYPEPLHCPKNACCSTRFSIRVSPHNHSIKGPTNYPHSNHLAPYLPCHGGTKTSGPLDLSSNDEAAEILEVAKHAILQAEYSDPSPGQH